MKVTGYCYEKGQTHILVNIAVPDDVQT